MSSSNLRIACVVRPAPQIIRMAKYHTTGYGSRAYRRRLMVAGNEMKKATPPLAVGKGTGM